MTPEFADLIASYPEASEETIKLIFLRDEAKRSYIEGKIEECTTSTLQEIIQTGTVGNMDKESISTHIANLEKCRSYISCIIQGYKIALTEELAPEFKRKHEARMAEKKSGITRKSLDDKLAAFGLSLDSFSKKVIDSPVIPPKEIVKVVCPKCGKETISLSFHNC